MKVHFPFTAFGFEEALSLASPRLLDDLDGGAVRGNVLDADSQAFSKPQPRCGEEREHDAVFFLLGLGQDARDYLA